MLLPIVFCGLFTINSVFAAGKYLDLSAMLGRLQLKNKGIWQPANTNLASPEVDSSEHGITIGTHTTNCVCGWSNRPAPSHDTRIIGGKVHSPYEYPFIAGVAHIYQANIPHCGSVIISPWHVITAAHCTANAQSLVVTIGEYDRSGAPLAPLVIRVARIIDHEGYDNATLRHDISFLLLEQPIPLNQYMGPACLPSGPLNLVNQHVRIIGWGAMQVNTPMTVLPQKVDVRVIDIQTCNQAWKQVLTYPATQICTHSKKKTACQGDSGGPVVWLDPETNRYTIVGLVSFGPACEDVIPSVQTSVESYLPWIYARIQETVPGQMVCFKSRKL